ncbi:MAG: glutamate--tRNA ligase [Acidobacteriia bacterium]|nr:glutamate--tRNA ligase [Terriglobia bacterium]
MATSVRVRFAPSPTGYLHVGGARTALFNWLFARHHGGKFVLRIEDTDLARSSEEMVEGILQGMRWLGLDWDEGPYFQSQRLDRYQAFARSLLGSGHAYRCFCTPEELGRRKGAQQGTGGTWLYDRHCLALPPDESESLERSGAPFAVRFQVPEGKTSYLDHVFGRIEVEHATVEDFVLLRSDGVPTYHLGVVVDDLDMDITHVVRGADHISNTPKQILLYQAAGQPLPEFAHVPLILGPDKQRLSKRHGATSVMAYMEMGYLPEAFFNFLALLGWSPGDDREILSRRELVSLFSLEGVGKANAVFGIDKLNWFNGQYINATPPAELRRLVAAELRAVRVWQGTIPGLDLETMDRTLALLKNRAHVLKDFSGRFRAFFTNRYEYDPAASAKFLDDPQLKTLIPALLDRYERDASFTPESTEQHLRALAQESGIKAGVLINALRVGLTGQGVAPGLFEVMQVLGRERTLERMRRLAHYLEQLHV